MPSTYRQARRIVSLVPSLTESLFALGLGDRVVGVTDWCIHPADAVAPLPKVGGTKDTDVDAIVALAPDLVIANHEENTKRVVDRLEAAGLRVWVTYPRTVQEGAALLRQLGQRLGASSHAMRDAIDPVDAEIEAAIAAHPVEPLRVFCPIWRDPWMTIGRDTYVHSMIELCGGVNVFADRADRRYPRIELDDVVAAAPDVILLPDEPYTFGARDVAELADLGTRSGREWRIHCVDGTWVSWYGPRIRSALRGLRPLLAPHRVSGSSPPDES